MNDLDPLQPHYTHDNLTTLQTHILAAEQMHPEATGDFSWLLSAIALAGKTIANKVRRARIEDVLGDHGGVNVHGEKQQKLDVIANEIILRCLGDRANIAVLASEEGEEPIFLRTRDEGGRYCVLFDPLDGSSNLDVSVGVGTIFSILRNERREQRDVPPGGERRRHPDSPHYLQPGSQQVAAGYILYGSSVVFVLTTGHGVDMFVLDQSIGAFLRVTTNLRIPRAKKLYSINEAYHDSFSPAYKEYLRFAHETGYTSRYIGSMVADVHRTLVLGGVFLYPPTEEHDTGKLRLMYEANPMAMLVEQAGGKALAGSTRILDINPDSLHQRTPVIIGSEEEVNHVARFIEAEAAAEAERS